MLPLLYYVVAYRPAPTARGYSSLLLHALELGCVSAGFGPHVRLSPPLIATRNLFPAVSWWTGGLVCARIENGEHGILYCRHTLPRVCNTLLYTCHAPAAHRSQPAHNGRIVRRYSGSKAGSAASDDVTLQRNPTPYSTLYTVYRLSDKTTDES